MDTHGYLVPSRGWVWEDFRTRGRVYIHGYGSGELIPTGEFPIDTSRQEVRQTSHLFTLPSLDNLLTLHAFLYTFFFAKVRSRFQSYTRVLGKR
jgi:hypothetical protein